MLTSGDRQRQRLFRTYAANLAIHVPGLTGRFGCPVCRRVFTEAAVLSPHMRVDIGHVYPEAAGGRLTTLECCGCNGRLNDEADNELVTLHRHWDAAVGKPGAKPIKGHIVTRFGRVAVYYTKNQITGHWRRASPAAFKGLISKATGGRGGRLLLPRPDMRKVERARLHAAHLLLFSAFGYEYLLSPWGSRHQRFLHAPAGPEDPELLTFDLHPTEARLSGRYLYRAGTCALPDGGKCLVVVLPSPDPARRCTVLVMPGPGADEVEHFRQMRAGGLYLRDSETRLWDPGPRERLTAPEFKDLLRLLWAGMDRHDINMDKLMEATHAAAGRGAVQKVDLTPIASRFGIKPDLLGRYVHWLAELDLLTRVPKRGRPHLVGLTPKALSDG